MAPNACRSIAAAVGSLLAVAACGRQPSGSVDATPPAVSAAVLPGPDAGVRARDVADARPRPRARPTVEVFERGIPAEGFLPRGDARALGLDGRAVDELVREAERTESDALILVRDGRVAVERTFGRPRGPIETMSVTKSIVALAIGILVDRGKIASLDAPLSTWFPEWKEGRKGRVTLRHVLTQTTGLAHRSSTRVLNAKADRLAFARASAIDEEPGTRFSYNNEATQLLSGVVRAAAGQSVDAYLRRRLFAPLGIRRFRWDRDRAGNAQTYYGCELSGRDLARLGVLMLSRGRWHGEQILPASWVDRVASPSENNPYYGLLWWIRYDSVVQVQTAQSLAALRAARFEQAAALEPLTGRRFPSAAAYFLEAGARLDSGGRAALAELVRRGRSPIEERPGNAIGLYADGWLGQRLAVYPEWKLVAVRLHRRSRRGDDAENQKLGFRKFLSLVEATVAGSK